MINSDENYGHDKTMPDNITNISIESPEQHGTYVLNKLGGEGAKKR